MTNPTPNPFEEQHQPPINAPGTTSSVLFDTSPGPFEGPEKLLEIWFAPSPQQLPKVTRKLGDGLEYRAKRKSKVVGQEAQEEEREWKGLRRVKREIWEDMLRVVKCQVLSVIEGEEVDAYLLSESSLFIADHLIILKTCGTTINLLGLTRIIEIAREYCGFDHVHRCFYSRKSFFFPERQVGPHRGWKEEVDFLDGVFNYQGNAYTVGPMNGDHWLLYLINPPSPTEEEIKDVKRGMTIGGGSKSISVTSDHRDHHHRDHDHDHDHHHHHHHHSHDSRQNGSYAAHGMDINIQRPSHAHQDQTLEILMTHLSADASAPFFHPPELDMNQASASGSSSTPASTAGAPEGVPRSGHYLGSLLTQHLGIDKLFDKDESIIDSFGFEPCGYSANGIIGSGSGYPSSSASTEVAAGTGKEQDQEGGGYWTIHVTPEEGWSFASFECNVPLPLKNEGLLPSGKRSHRPDLKTLIRRVVDIFEPGRLSITLFLSSESENALFNANNQSGDGTGNGSGNGTYSNPSESSSLADSGILADSGVLEPAHETEATRRAWTAFSKTLLGDAYVRKDRIGYEFEDYDLVFGCFEKRGFKRALKKAAPVQT